MVQSSNIQTLEQIKQKQKAHYLVCKKCSAALLSTIFKAKPFKSVSLCREGQALKDATKKDGEE